jgi:hypothetical protein
VNINRTSSARVLIVATESSSGFPEFAFGAGAAEPPEEAGSVEAEGGVAVFEADTGLSSL